MTLSAYALVTLNQAKNYLKLDAIPSLQISAEYVGTGDGTNVTFTLDHIPLEGALKVYVDSALKTETTHYTYTGTTLTFTVAGKPGNGKIVTAAYDYAATSDTFESYDDEQLENLIWAATKKAEDYTGRYFVQREVVEKQWGNGTTILRLFRHPVVSVASVTIDGTATTTYESRASIGRLYYEDTWPEDYEIVITYTAGYGASRAATAALIPDAMVWVLKAVANAWENRLGVKSQNISGIGSVEYDFSKTSMELLNSLIVNFF